MENILLIILIVLVVILIGMLAVVLYKLKASVSDRDAINKEQLEATVSKSNNEVINQLSRNMQLQTENITALNNQQITQFETRVQSLEKTNTAGIEQIRQEVGEKLQTRLGTTLTNSFNQVNVSLQSVNKGIGEMQALANSVGDLRKILDNVKTRGILGEYQLEAIMEEILSPVQYEKNAEVVPGSNKRVEFAVKIPSDDSKTIYLPIDSKFPGVKYHNYIDACERGNKQEAGIALNSLKAELEQCAKDIHDKYVSPPYTAEFGIMFLPFEGLHITAVNNGMVELLQKKYKICLAGPSTLAALLNVLQMGLKAISLKQHSDEVWNLLAEVKTEFAKFASCLEKVQKNFTATQSELDSLVGTRTRALTRKLNKIELPD